MDLAGVCNERDAITTSIPPCIIYGCEFFTSRGFF
jgi:hypothetical protein